MSLAHKAAAALTAGLLLAPAPALAAAQQHGHNGHHGHGGRHHAAAQVASRKAHLAARLAQLRSQVGKLHKQINAAGLTAHQQQVLTDRLPAPADLATAHRALVHAHSAKALRRIGQHVAELGAAIPRELQLVRLLARTDGAAGHWYAVEMRLSRDAQRLREGEENPLQMKGFDTAVARLDAAQELLSTDLTLLLKASGATPKALHAAVQRVAHDLSTVATDVEQAVAALTALETQLS